jgi:formate dehydrogenase iron-sulfur subunit
MSGRMGMLIDVSKCMGCRACQVACKQWNQLNAEETQFEGTYQNPPELSGQTWTLVRFKEIEKKKPEKPIEWLFRKDSCHHCRDATCKDVCPTGAIKRENGIVFIDQKICAGCKYCVETCPFHIPHPDHESGTARKCWMCLDRVQAGLEPACATACPTGAVRFGTRDEMVDLARSRLPELQKEHPDANFYGDNDMLKGLGVMYLLPEKPDVYGLPANPQVPHAKIYYRWAMGIIPGLAILGGIWAYLTKDES